MDTTKYVQMTTGRSLGSALLVLLWALGMVIAKGFWPMFFAIFTPYSLYLSVEAIARLFGVI